MNWKLKEKIETKKTDLPKLHPVILQILLERKIDTEEKINKVRQLNDLAKQRGQTLAEMAIAWLLKDDRVTSVLVGASSVAQLIDNLKALQNTAFSAEEIQMIENILQ